MRLNSTRARPGKFVQRWLGLAIVTTAAVLVFWAFDALPFQDLPAHAGLIALRHRLPTSPFEQRFLILAPHLGPYSLFRFLGEAFSDLLGPIAAMRAMATLPVIATPLALLWARRRLHGDRAPTAAYFGVALGFGFMTLLGFASYLLGLSLLIVSLTIWLELLVLVDVEDAGAGRREVAFTCCAAGVLFAHGHAFLILIAMAAVSAVATGQRRSRVIRLRALAPALALAAWVAWTQRASVVSRGSVALPRYGFEPHFQGVFDKISLLATPTLLTRTGVDVVVGLGVWASLGFGVVATARSVRASRNDGDGPSCAHARALLACMAALSAAFAILPHSIGWFGFVDGRLLTPILLLAVLAVRRNALAPRFAALFHWAAPAAAYAMTLIALAASYFFQSEARGWRDVLANIPANSRLLNLPLDPDSNIFTAHPFVHYDKLALAERPMLVSDVWFHQGSALFPTPDNPALRLPASYSESDLRAIDWPAYRLTDWDYALIRVRPWAPQPAVPDTLQLAAHSGGWWLFRTH